MMSLKCTLIWFCSVAVWFSSASQDETTPQNCSSDADQLLAALKVAAECGENPPWSAQQSAAVLLSMRNLTDALHKHHLKGEQWGFTGFVPFVKALVQKASLLQNIPLIKRECQGAEPRRCPEPEVPSNGGLACVTVANKRYCKPFCNHGYDFSFLRMSRVYDECSEQKGYRWNTQYIGGNRLAVCMEALIQVSGAKTAYFPKGQDCLTTKSNSVLHDRIIEEFTAELKGQGVQGQPQHVCLVCGQPGGTISPLATLLRGV